MYSPRKDIFSSKDFYSSKKHSDGLELEELELEKLELDFNILSSISKKLVRLQMVLLLLEHMFKV